MSLSPFPAEALELPNRTQVVRVLAGITIVNRSMFATGPRGDVVTETHRPLGTDLAASVERAVVAGARLLQGSEDMFWGDRYARLIEPYGHYWLLATPGPAPDPEAAAEVQINKMLETP